ncbi:MAG: tol-pal system protein YbgF [Hydrogenophilaceae bacterium]|nr:tol-pal system protein YbgF [Hydrogenophilaceae bacterium]
MTRARRLTLLLCLAWGTAAAAPAPVTEAGQPQPAALMQAIKALEDRFAKLEGQLENQGLLTLFNEVEQLKAELAKLKGTQEELGHRLATAEKRQKDFYTDLDGRLKELAQAKASPVVTPTAPSAPAAEAAASENETKAYQDAFAAIRAGNYQAAIKDFQAFLKAYPNSSLAGNAQYWIGFSQFSLGDFKATLESHQKLLQAYPDSPKAPDAMLGLARARMQLGDNKAAQATLEQIIKQYAGSRAAENAQKLLATLK